MGIQEITLWNPKEEEKDNFVFDIWDSLYQGTRILSRPLVAENETLRSFGSLQGRGVALLHLAKTICREPFRFLKHLIVIIAEIAKTVLAILNYPFSERTRASFFERIKGTWGSLVGIVLRPIAFVLELLRYLGAIIVHPWIGIRLENKNP